MMQTQDLKLASGPMGISIRICGSHPLPAIGQFFRGSICCWMFLAQTRYAMPIGFRRSIEIDI